MDIFVRLLQTNLIIVVIYIIAVMMRKRGILDEGHSLILARIVTDLCLPAVIFITMAQQSVELRQLSPALVMLLLEVGIVALAWFITSKMNFTKLQQGAIVFCSAFGSSSFLGYAIILQMFPDQPEAMTEAVLISEVGVGYPIFILGPILAAYFGTTEREKNSIINSIKIFIKSPVFIALIAGLLWGYLDLPHKENFYLAPIFKLGDILSSALTPIAILSVGLMFKVPKIKVILIPLGIVIALKLFFKPFLAGSISTFLAFPELWKEVLVLLAAMPPAILGAVFIRRSGGDAALASSLLLAATIISSGTLLLVFWFIG